MISQIGALGETLFAHGAFEQFALVVRSPMYLQCALPQKSFACDRMPKLIKRENASQ